MKKSKNHAKAQPELVISQTLLFLVPTFVICSCILILLTLITKTGRVSADVMTPQPAIPTSLPTATTVINEDPGITLAPIQNETRIPILMYHYIRNFKNKRDKIGRNLSVSPETFRQQLNTLKEAGYTPVTFDDLNKPIPEKPIILTFDDGYADAYTEAFPALQEAGMKGVFYVISGFLNTPDYLSEEQVKSLAASGMEIGAHTVGHKDLSRQNSEVQRKELQESKARLEQLISKAVTAFCYPLGKYTGTTVQLAKEVGYTTATTTKFGIATGKSLAENPFELRRIRVTNDSDILSLLR